MSELILHHYATSPFSEKIRLILGAKKLSWKSVSIPRIMPKPDVVALTGGYRKTPILQIGADIYCDSALIAKKLDEQDGSLFPSRCAASALAFSQWADTVLFGVAVRHVFQPANLTHMFGDSPGELEAFMKDRQAMRANATTRRLSELEALATANSFLKSFDVQLQAGSAFACGDQLSIADFSVFHCLWFMRRAPLSEALVLPHAHVLAWMDRIAGFGHGSPTELSSSEAVRIAQQSLPQPIRNAKHAGAVKIGDEIEILPTDYGIDPTRGTLVSCNEEEYVLRRVDARAGEVFVHFPRLNYELRAVNK